MTKKEIERVQELHKIMQGSKIYAFTCNVCMLLAQTTDCKGCPVYGAGV